MDTVLLSLGGFSFTVPAAASVVTGLTALGLGLRVLLREQRAEENLYFLFFCLVIFLWLLSFGFMYAAPDAGTARRWMHVGYMAIPFVPATIYRFTVQILGSNRRRRVVMGMLWTAAALLVVLFVGGGVFTERMTRLSWGWIEMLNPWGLVLVGFLVASVSAALLEYALVLPREESPARRRQLRLLLAAFAIGGLSVVDYLPAFGIAVPPLGYLPVLGGLLILAHVVQRHRLVELTTEEARRAVERAEQKFAGLFELNPLAIGLATLDGSRFLEVNESFEDFFGVPREEAIGRSPVELGLWVDPADRERVVAAVRSGGAVDGMEVQMKARGDEVRDVLFFADAMELDGTACLLAMAYDITERKSFEKELERRALYDPLTDLPNRSLLRDRLGHALDRARRQGTTVGVLFLDLDRFKIVNDSMGHAAGDEVLRQTAGRLRELVRGEDTVARMGGDEFVVVLESLEGAAESRTVARRIGEELSRPFSVGEEEVHLSASAGIALSESADASAEELLRRSDVAMYRAKDRGGTGFHVFDPATDRWAAERLQEENELRRAVEGEDLVLHYQPVVRLSTGRIVGAEALVRWQHPDRGLVPPAEFIPLAEETGLIVPLGEWALRSATRDAVGWRRPRDPSEPLHLGLNVSARQMEDAGAVDRMRRALEACGMSTDRLILEMTETTAIRNREGVRELRELGVRVAVDDLGTGYASLEYLTRLEVDLMKVDRLFVSGIGEDPRDEAIVEAAALIAHRLEKSLVAEGIETGAQLRRLRELGYDYAQGYYFAKPLPAAAFEKLLREDPAWSPEPSRRSLG